MSQHHNAIRYGDEYQCSTCGKAWGVKDKDIPDCCENGPTFEELPSVEVSMLKAQVAGLKDMLNGYEGNDGYRLNWSPKQWYNHLNILKLRDTINTHK